MDKPRSVRIGVNLMWLSLVVSVINAIYMMKTNTTALMTTTSGQTVSIWVLALATVVYVAISAFFIAMVAKGKNWSRIICLIFFIIGAVMWAVNIRYQMGQSIVATILSAITYVLFLVALILVFKKEAKPYFCRPCVKQ